jgi:hypothetical protein
MKILILIFLISINFSFAQSKDRKISLWYNYGTVPVGKKDLFTSNESIDFIQTEKGDYMIVKYNQTKPQKLKNGGKPGRSSITGEVAYRNPPKVEGIGLPLISQNIIISSAGRTTPSPWLCLLTSQLASATQVFDFQNIKIYFKLMSC